MFDCGRRPQPIAELALNGQSRRIILVDLSLPSFGGSATKKIIVPR